MSDDTTQTDSYDDVMLRYAAFQVARAELHAGNKVKLFALLAQAGITSLIVRFDGGGDSGQIEEIDARRGEEATEVPTGDVELLVTNYGADRAFAETQPIDRSIETFCYALLASAHDGWENNEGAYGEFIFDIAAGTVTLDFNYRVIETEHHSHIF
ncbi:DUF6878 family protein [Sphingomonas oryzagri]|uniref:DUF6878 domain-containing protein n=1 Tax=Sphingomonas oryzagri TaxID=3042314 RepID=A0ABT6N1Q8_9SPHN|nr:DUF6878 family protein [Sphingomonas oryzagri]MDH7639210.1 hypothetical protein [Sphingomonas oryzagri]